jgi:perosamine synthetase
MDRICAARNWAGDRLTEQLQGLPGVTPATTQPGGVHTYWSYPLRIDEEQLGMTKERFAECVRAEGADIATGYIGMPIYMYEYIRRQHIYGNSRCPFDCPKYGSGHEIQYEAGYCPQADLALAQMANLHVSEFFQEQDVDDLAAIVRKVALAN